MGSNSQLCLLMLNFKHGNYQPLYHESFTTHDCTILNEKVKIDLKSLRSQQISFKFDLSKGLIFLHWFSLLAGICYRELDSDIDIKITSVISYNLLHVHTPNTCSHTLVLYVECCKFCNAYCSGNCTWDLWFHSLLCLFSGDLS